MCMQSVITSQGNSQETNFDATHLFSPCPTDDSGNTQNKQKNMHDKQSGVHLLELNNLHRLLNTALLDFILNADNIVT